jgi:hypothetical protein
MVISTVAEIKIETLHFKVKNVSDVAGSYILMNITGQIRESIFHWIGIWANDMSVIIRRIWEIGSIGFARINEKRCVPGDKN